MPCVAGNIIVNGQKQNFTPTTTTTHQCLSNLLPAILPVLLPATKSFASTSKIIASKKKIITSDITSDITSNKSLVIAVHFHFRPCIYSNISHPLFPSAYPHHLFACPSAHPLLPSTYLPICFPLIVSSSSPPSCKKISFCLSLFYFIAGLGNAILLNN